MKERKILDKKKERKNESIETSNGWAEASNLYSHPPPHTHASIRSLIDARPQTNGMTDGQTDGWTDR